MTVCGTQLRPGRDYIFTLTVYKTGRRAASVNQTVSITNYLTPFSNTAALHFKNNIVFLIQIQMEIVKWLAEKSFCRLGEFFDFNPRRL